MDGPGISELELNQLEEIILSKVQQRTPPRMNEDTYIVKAFRYHDLGNTGWCEFDTFKKALVPFTSGINEQDLHSIFLRYGPEGALHYKNFAMDFVAGVRRMPGLASEADGEAWETVEDTLLRIKVFLYSQGPLGIISLATAFRDADPSNVRALSYDAFGGVMANYFGNSSCQVSDDSIDQIFQVFRQPYAPSQVAYDEFFLALKEEPSQERRATIRAAFRRLDAHSESLVDMKHMVRSFNATRHPEVSDGSRSPEEVLDEFAETLKDLVAFRRGQRSYPTNLVAWEEFEDYYKFISGCYENDGLFCTILTRVWDLDKVPNMSIDSRASMAAPAAGVPPKSRAGLHHWQSNTLPAHHHRSGENAVNLSDVLLRARRMIAKQGLRFAVDVVKNFYAADDDVDDMVDTYEFRRACQLSKLGFRDAEEVAIFEAAGFGEPGSKGAKLQVPRFLQMLHGELSQTRILSIEQAFVSLGGDPNNEEVTISPAILKEHLACEKHPLVVRGELDCNSVLSEFLDTFSLLAHVRGGCQNGMVAFSDFQAYYEVVSSLIDNDAFFHLLLRRLWDPSEEDDLQETPVSPQGARNGGGYPRRQNIAPGGYDLPISSSKRESPMAEPRPPVHNGPSAYATAASPTDQQHRRFLRKEFPGVGGPDVAAVAPPNSGFSPITKSNIKFDEADTSELGIVLHRLRESLAKRGLRGWKSLADKFGQYDNRRNGGIMRLDFERLHKTLGLGLSPEEREALFKGLAQTRKDGAMDYRLCLQKLKGQLRADRVAPVDCLFDMLQQQGEVGKEALKSNFHAKNTPACMLGKKDVNTTQKEFDDAVDFFGGPNANINHTDFIDLFAIISAIHMEDDEFNLMMTAAFGLSSG